MRKLDSSMFRIGRIRVAFITFWTAAITLVLILWVRSYRPPDDAYCDVFGNNSHMILASSWDGRLGIAFGWTVPPGCTFTPNSGRTGFGPGSRIYNIRGGRKEADGTSQFAASIIAVDFTRDDEGPKFLFAQHGSVNLSIFGIKFQYTKGHWPPISPIGGNVGGFRLQIPHWLAVFLLLIGATPTFWQIRRKIRREIMHRRVKAGLCPTCSYDLRAHLACNSPAGNKCPECGSPIPRPN